MLKISNSNQVNEKGRLVSVAITCKDCQQQFTIDQGQIHWYSNMGFPLPKRCPECRKKRKEQRNTTTTFCNIFD